MSKPKFLADNDLRDSIVFGVLRREPAIEFVRVRHIGLDSVNDSEVLEFASNGKWIVVSHDVNTMSAAAFERMDSGLAMAGLFLAKQRGPVGPLVESLHLIWDESEAAEWVNIVEFLPL